MNQKEHDKEIGRWQESIYELIKKISGADSEIDGGCCDSGDDLDGTLVEIEQGFEFFKQRVIEACAKVLEDEHKKLSKRSYPPPQILIKMAKKVRNVSI
ncbi:MAG: hypothetical protein UW18_C0021G0005 [Microgenomates group bacterium GW2011_GWF1_44_10]|nr:MAG: hypothetical protein UW18_C0021G0005 [Microgenomates group bacterium GW2011_GWF1_44_10]